MKVSGIFKTIAAGAKELSAEVDAWEIVDFIKLQSLIDNTDVLSIAVSKLSKSNDSKIFRFDDTIRKFIYNIDGKIWASQVYDDIASVDKEEFLAIRCAAVAMGDSYYTKILELKKPLDKSFVFLELLDIAPLAWADKHNASPADYPHVSTIDCSTFSNTEKWDKTLQEDEINLNMTDKGRLKAFVEKVVKNEEVWLIYDENDYRLFVIPDNSELYRYIPLYPDIESAEIFLAKHPDEKWTAKQMDLYEFMDFELTDLIDSQFFAGPHWQDGEYLDKSFEEIKKALIKELLQSSTKGGADKDAIIERLAKGQISEALAEYLFDRVISKGLPFSTLERDSYIDGISLKKIAEYRTFGWPTYCSRCYEKIDYSSKISIIEHELIICDECTKITESEEGVEELPLDESALETIAQYGFDTKGMIEKLRKEYSVYGDSARDRLIVPDWLEDGQELSESSELLKKLYDSPEILKIGQLVYGCLVQSNGQLMDDYQIGESIALPADVIYSLDPYYDEKTFELVAIMNKVYSYKDSHIFPSELETIKEYFSNSGNVVYNLKLPDIVTGGREVYITTFMVQRNHIPLMKISGRIIPLLANPEKCDTVTIVPKRYWPLEMIYLSYFSDDDYFEGLS